MLPSRCFQRGSHTIRFSASHTIHSTPLLDLVYAAHYWLCWETTFMTEIGLKAKKSTDNRGVVSIALCFLFRCRSVFPSTTNTYIQIIRGKSALVVWYKLFTSYNRRKVLYQARYKRKNRAERQRVISKSSGKSLLARHCTLSSLGQNNSGRLPEHSPLSVGLTTQRPFSRVCSIRMSESQDGECVRCSRCEESE